MQLLTDLSIKTLEQWGIVRREKWELMSFGVMEYTAGSHAQIRSTRKYLVLGDEGNFKEYPDYYWRTETQVCDLVWEAEKWKIDECRYVISDW